MLSASQFIIAGASRHLVSEAVSSQTCLCLFWGSLEVMHNIFHQIPDASTKTSNPRYNSVMCYRILYLSSLLYNQVTFSITCSLSTVLVTEHCLRFIFSVLVVEWLKYIITFMCWAVLTCNLTQEVCGGVQMWRILVCADLWFDAWRELPDSPSANFYDQKLTEPALPREWKWLLMSQFALWCHVMLK